MKETICCISCARAAVRIGCGFAGVETVYCTDTGRETSPDDGCTFGEPGKPGAATIGYQVDIGPDAAVKGYGW